MQLYPAYLQQSVVQEQNDISPWQLNVLAQIDVYAKCVRAIH